MYTEKSIILIPSRMGSVRLPYKAIAPIQGEPMIVHVWRQACQQGVPHVAVACDDEAIGQPIVEAGGMRILTDPSRPSGSDRCAEAIEHFDPQGKIEYVMNLQGDLPYFTGKLPLLFEALEKNPSWDMATFAQPYDASHPKGAPQTVNVVIDEETMQCKDFSRQHRETPYYHIGVYAFRREALRRYAQLPQTPREHEERLEQIRALEAGFTIGAVLMMGELFISVDTQGDLDHARSVIEGGARQIS